MIDEGDVLFGEDETTLIKPKKRLENAKDALRSIIYEDGRASSNYVDSLLSRGVFNNPKSHTILERVLGFITNDKDIILDFFAGSGTTGDAVMQLNAEDGGNRKFILCQEDRKIEKDKPAYKFCIDNNLPPVISSITIERLKRAGEKIVKKIETENSKTGMFDEDKKQVPDVGFKVFDSVEAPKLKVDDKGQISITENESDALSRIYNMIFTIGLDEPSQEPEEVVKDCIYKIGNHYYITNSLKITSDDYSNAIKNGKVFIDGWTASLNGTLQNYKEDVKIVF
jgi:adenine-specific DNA-methyltransferase